MGEISHRHKGFSSAATKIIFHDGGEKNKQDEHQKKKVKVQRFRMQFFQLIGDEDPSVTGCYVPTHDQTHQI